MTWRIDQIEQIFMSVLAVIAQLNGIQFDRDAAFTFKFHIIQQLVFHITLLDRIGHFKDTVCQSGLSVIDMGNNTEVANIFLIH